MADVARKLRLYGSLSGREVEAVRSFGHLTQHGVKLAAATQRLLDGWGASS